MTAGERERIAQAGREAARVTRLAQGLPARVTDQRVIEQIAAIVRGAAHADERMAA
jgi:hypothetical protein